MPASRADRARQLLELASTQGGYFTSKQARSLGVSARSLVHHVAAGRVQRVARGFYRLAGIPADPHDDVVAAWLRFASRGAVVSHETALALYDLAPARSSGIHLTLPRQSRPRTARRATTLTLHTTTTPLRRDELTTRFGVRLTAPARTLADSAEAGVDPSVIAEATARALATGLVSESELRAAAKPRPARVRRLVERSIAEAGSRA